MIEPHAVTVLAHGVGGSTDLPIPLSVALIGAAWALTFTFAVVAFAWRRPDLTPPSPGVPCQGGSPVSSTRRSRAALLQAAR